MLRKLLALSVLSITVVGQMNAFTGMIAVLAATMPRFSIVYKPTDITSAYVCNECPEKTCYRSQKSLHVHTVLVHPPIFQAQQSAYVCNECPEKTYYRSKKSLYVHTLLVHDVNLKNYNKKLADRKVNDSKQLNIHSDGLKVDLNTLLNNSI